MAPTGPEDVPEPAPAEQPPPAAKAPRFRRGRGLWLLVVCVAAAVLGLVVGASIAMRGRSLSPASVPLSRPTFVISASVSPIPSPSASAVASATTPAAPTASGTETEYVVQPGDTLRSIAQDVYGDANAWPRLYAANRDVIGDDPDSLQAGEHLRVP